MKDLVFNLRVLVVSANVVESSDEVLGSTGKLQCELLMIKLLWRGWEVTNTSYSFPCKIEGAYLLNCKRNRSLSLRNGCEPWVINERSCFLWSHIHSSKSWDIKASVDTVSVHSAEWIWALQYHMLRSF